jgi:SMC interacting uncharacterized protein involved in chromosome segregation
MYLLHYLLRSTMITNYQLQRLASTTKLEQRIIKLEEQVKMLTQQIHDLQEQVEQREVQPRGLEQKVFEPLIQNEETMNEQIDNMMNELRRIIHEE